jgi:hypothetical protein
MGHDIKIDVREILRMRSMEVAHDHAHCVLWCSYC